MCASWSGSHDFGQGSVNILQHLQSDLQIYYYMDRLSMNWTGLQSWPAINFWCAQFRLFCRCPNIYLNAGRRPALVMKLEKLLFQSRSMSCSSPSIIIIRPHCLHIVRMMWHRPIATDVCWACGWAVQKWLNRSRCCLVADSFESKQPCIWWRMNQFVAARGDKTVMRPFAKNNFGHFVIIIIVIIIIIIIIVRS